MTKAANIIGFWCWLALNGQELGLLASDLGDNGVTGHGDAKDKPPSTPQPPGSPVKKKNLMVSAIKSLADAVQGSRPPVMTTDMKEATVSEKKARTEQALAAAAALQEDKLKTRAETALTSTQNINAQLAQLRETVSFAMSLPEDMRGDMAVKALEKMRNLQGL